jgi:hypothetical protein
MKWITPAVRGRFYLAQKQKARRGPIRQEKAAPEPAQAQAQGVTMELGRCDIMECRRA